MRRSIAIPAAVTAAALAVAPATAAPLNAPTPVRAVAAKTCSAGFKHARINGAQKCLRVGEFCAHAYDHRAPHHYAYKHYGYACKKRDSRGSYHLTYRY